MESLDECRFKEMAADLKQEAAALTGDRLLAAEAATEAAEARLCATLHTLLEALRLGSIG